MRHVLRLPQPRRRPVTGAPVRPYERRGADIRQLRVESSEDFLRVTARFREEEDVWLRKMLALRLLEHAEAATASQEVRDGLQEAIKCRVT